MSAAVKLQGVTTAPPLLTSLADFPAEPGRVAAAIAGAALRIPAVRSERWRYSAWRPLAGLAVGPAEPVDPDLVEAALGKLALPATSRLVMVDGVIVRPLAALPGCDPLVDSASAWPVPDDEPLEQLAATLGTPGLSLRLADGVKAPFAMVGLHMAAAASGVDAGEDPRLPAALVHHRIAIGEAAELDLDWAESNEPTAHGIGIVRTCIDVGLNARLRLRLRVIGSGQRRLHTALRIHVAKGATVSLELADAADAAVRHVIEVVLAGPGAALDLRGAAVVQGEAAVDTLLDIRHRATDTRSVTTYRAIAGGRGKVALAGAIAVEPGADRSDAALSARGVLLATTAEIDLKPVLEIDTDEVIASHGAAIGALDEAAWFYLRSRGIPTEAARDMLLAALIREVIEDPSSALALLAALGSDHQDLTVAGLAPD